MAKDILVTPSMLRRSSSYGANRSEVMSESVHSVSGDQKRTVDEWRVSRPDKSHIWLFAAVSVTDNCMGYVLGNLPAITLLLAAISK